MTLSLPQLRFFELLYGDRCGFVEVSYIDGDPRFEKMRRADFFKYTPARAHALARLCGELASRYGNVYVSNTLYAQPRRTIANALPSRIVFVDDAPAGSYSVVVRTSEHSRHAYFLLDVEVSPSERRDLQRRAARALDADPSGADVTQLVRVPESFNTKHHARYPVTLESDTGRVYTPDELRALFPAIDRTSTGAASTGAASTNESSSTGAALDWPQVEHWLGNIDTLIGWDGLPRRLSRDAHARRVLAAPETPSDTSLARFMVAKGLVLHRYPNEEAAALLIHFCDYGASESKGSAWLYHDIAESLRKLRTELPDKLPEPSRVLRTKAPASLPQRQPTRKGRKMLYTLSDAFQRLSSLVACSGRIIDTRKERARALGVSEPTQKRLEVGMEQAGWIRIEMHPSRRTSFVILTKEADLGVIKIDPAPPEKAGCNFDHTPAIQPVPTPCSDAPKIHEGTHPPDLAGARVVVALGQLVREGMDAYGHTLRRVARYVLDNGGAHFLPAAIARTYRAELDRRRRARAAALLAQQLPTMRWSALQQRATAAARRALAEQRKGSRAASWWTYYAGQLEGEITRRTEAGAIPVPAARRPARRAGVPTHSAAPAGAIAGGCVPSPVPALADRVTDQARPATGPSQPDDLSASDPAAWLATLYPHQLARLAAVIAAGDFGWIAARCPDDFTPAAVIAAFHACIAGSLVCYVGTVAE